MLTRTQLSNFFNINLYCFIAKVIERKQKLLKSVTTFQEGETLRCKQIEFSSESCKANKTVYKTISNILKFRNYVILQGKNKRA